MANASRFEHLRANHTDDMLIAKAEAAGWQWGEHKSPWGGEPLVAWMQDNGSSQSFCAGPSCKAEYLRGRLNCGPTESLGFDHELLCHECGRPIWLHWVGDCEQRLIEKLECFDCNLWLGHIATFGPRDIIRVRSRDGEEWREHWSIGARTKPSSYNGCAGAWWTVRFTDGRVVETCDLWCGGRVPERFYDRLPINAQVTAGQATCKESLQVQHGE